MIFIGMLAFQLAGALILLLNCIVGNKKAVIRNCFPGSNFVERDDEDNCIIPKEKLQKSAHVLYLNIVAFADLVIGYLIASFSPVSTSSDEYTVLGVIGATAVLLLLEYFLSQWLSRKLYAEDMKIQYKALKKNGVDTVATEKEINDILSGVFNDGEGKNYGQEYD